MLTYEEAYNATNPDDSEEVRKDSANRILLGARANEMYWNSRPELEALRAQAEGHGVVQRGSDEEEGSPTVVGTSTADVIEGSATEEPATGIGQGASGTAEGTPPPAPAATEVAATPPPEAATVTDTDNAERLRAQLRNAGLDPEV